MWELFIQFDGMKFVQHTLRRSDIRYLNLLSLMEKEGYGMGDSMYYVKSEGEGLNGLELVDSNAKVLQMIKKYESIKKLLLTVMRDRRCQAIVLSPIKRKIQKKRQVQAIYKLFLMMKSTLVISTHKKGCTSTTWRHKWVKIIQKKRQDKWSQVMRVTAGLMQGSMTQSIHR